MGKNKNNFIKAGTIYIVGSFFAQGLRFITLPIFSRLMQPIDYGYIASYELWVSIITVFIGLQTSATIANAYIDFGEIQIEKYTSAVATVGTCSLLVVSIAVYFFRKLFVYTFELPFTILIFGVVQCYFSYIILMLCGKYRILEKPYYYILFSISNSILSIGLSMFMVYTIDLPKYISYIIGLLISNSCVGLIAIVCIYLRGKCLFNYIMTKYALKLSSPLILHNLSSIILSRVNQILLLKFVGAAEAGLYNFGNNFAFIVNALYTAFNQAYIPWYYKQLSKKNINVVAVMSQNYIKLFTIIVICIILGIPEIIKVMSTEEYYSIIDIIPIVMSGMYINFLYTFSVNYELYSKKTQYVAIGTLITTFFNIAANVILIQKFNIYGAAVATLLSMLLLLVMHYYIANRVIGGFELKLVMYIKPVVAIALSGGVYYIFIDMVIVRWALISILGMYFLKEVKNFIKG